MNNTNKKLKIEFTIVKHKCETMLLYRVLEQVGLPKRKDDGNIKIIGCPQMKIDCEFSPNILYLRGSDSNLNDIYDSIIISDDDDEDAVYTFHKIIQDFKDDITKELFSHKLDIPLEWGKTYRIKNKDARVWQTGKYVGKDPTREDTNIFIVNGVAIRFTEYKSIIDDYLVFIRDDVDNRITFTWEEKLQ